MHPAIVSTPLRSYYMHYSIIILLTMSVLLLFRWGTPSRTAASTEPAGAGCCALTWGCQQAAVTGRCRCGAETQLACTQQKQTAFVRCARCHVDVLTGCHAALKQHMTQVAHAFTCVECSTVESFHFAFFAKFTQISNLQPIRKSACRMCHLERVLSVLA